MTVRHFSIPVENTIRVFRYACRLPVDGSMRMRITVAVSVVRASAVCMSVNMRVRLISLGGDMTGCCCLQHNGAQKDAHKKSCNTRCSPKNRDTILRLLVRLFSTRYKFIR